MNIRSTRKSAPPRNRKGEAFFESLIVDYAIPHRIARQNDLGVDFLCEWIHGDRPTGILFSAQVKTTTAELVQPAFVRQSELNGLDIDTLAGADKVDHRTINYWQGLGLARRSYLSSSKANQGAELACRRYYKRYTPPSSTGFPNTEDKTGSRSFHLANNEATFRAFADSETQIGGFARDLIIDYARLSYSKGHIVQLTPRQLGFWPFRGQTGFPRPCGAFGEIVRVSLA